MLKNKLILFEGIPGSGKSTAATVSQGFLEKQGIATRFWREGDLDHPADFEGVACLNSAGYQDLLTRYPGLADRFRENLSTHGADHLLSYRKLQRDSPQALPQPLLEEFARCDVYDGLSAAEYCRLALGRWQDFERAALGCSVTTLLECCLLQNPLTVLLARHDADAQLVRRHIGAIASIIQDLDPLVIYLAPQDARAALERVRAERPREWADFVTTYLTRQAYGQSHGLAGFGGVIEFYEMRQRMEIEILRELPLQFLIVENPGRDWGRCNQEIVDFFKLALA